MSKNGEKKLTHLNRREVMLDQDWKYGGLARSKYVVRKTCKECGGDGKGSGGLRCRSCRGLGSISVDPNAAYFVLRIDGGHDPHARKALACYAESVEADNPEFASDIREWLIETSQRNLEPNRP